MVFLGVTSIVQMIKNSKSFAFSKSAPILRSVFVCIVTYAENLVFAANDIFTPIR